MAEGASLFRPRHSQPEPPPDEPLLDGGDEIGGDVARRDREVATPRAEGQGELEAALLGLDQAEAHLVAETGAQDAAQLADAVDEAVRERGPAGEDVAVEERGLLALELGAAALAHEVLEGTVDVLLDRGE